MVFGAQFSLFSSLAWQTPVSTCIPFCFQPVLLAPSLSHLETSNDIRFGDTAFKWHLCSGTIASCFPLWKLDPLIQRYKISLQKAGILPYSTVCDITFPVFKAQWEAGGTFLGEVDWGPYSSPWNHYRGNCSFHAKARLALPSTMDYYVEHTRAWEAKDLPDSCFTPL